MTILPPSLSISLARVEAQLNLVCNRVNIQNNTTMRINQTVSNVSRTVTRIQTFDDPELRRLTEEALQDIRATQRAIQDFEREVGRRIQGIGTRLDEISTTFEDGINGIESEIGNKTNQLNNRIDSSKTQINARVDESRNVIVTRINTFNGEILAEFTGLEALIVGSRALAEQTKALLLVEIGGVAAEIAVVLGLVRVIESIVLYNRRVIQSEAGNTRSQLDTKVQRTGDRVLNGVTKALQGGFKDLATKVDAVSKNVADVQKQLDELQKKLPGKVAEEVSLQVVGESYYRWDSVSTYFPTLSFLFREINVEAGPRRTQIKVRLKQRNQEIQDADVARIEASCASLDNLQYTYGTLRANYVNHDKRFKTTVFCQDVDNVDRVLKPICDVIGDPYERQNLSLTAARSRSNPHRRTTPIAGVGVNSVLYQTTIIVKLYKVVLLINGAASPIVIYKSKI